LPDTSQNASGVANFFAELIEAQEVAARARVLAGFASQLIPDSAVNVYTLASGGEGSYWTPRATIGDASIHEHAIASDSGLLGDLFDGDAQPITKSAPKLQREDYPHIDARRTVRSISCVPLFHGENLVGAIEVLSFGADATPAALATLVEVSDAAAASLISAQQYETERHDTLSSITRLTQLYDLEKVFSSTLEMEELLPSAFPMRTTPGSSRGIAPSATIGFAR
jgi:GAF domain-containing protein